MEKIFPKISRWEMNKRRFLIISILVIISGFVGGAVSSFLFASKLALAKEKNIVIAEEFRLIDGNGRIRGGLNVANSLI